MLNKGELKKEREREERIYAQAPFTFFCPFFTTFVCLKRKESQELTNTFLCSFPKDFLFLLSTMY